MVQGSKQAPVRITFELRTDKVGCAGRARYSAIRVPISKGRNKSGTAEDLCAFVSYYRDKGASFYRICGKKKL